MRPNDSSPALYYKRSIVTMRLSCTIMEIWRLKDNGVTLLTFLWSRNVIGHLTIRLPGINFLSVVHGDHASICPRYGDMALQT